jgi:hypothetical protein
VLDGIVVQIDLAPGRELRGWMRRLDEPRALPFRGWIDFMAALTALRDAADETDS